MSTATKKQKTPRLADGSFSISYTSKKIENVFPIGTAYQRLSEKILSKKYTLSLVLTDPKTIQKLNVQYRRKDYVPNVLSFPLSKTEGEIYICPDVAKNEAAEYGHSVADHIRYLYIHGCLHLKGLPHGKEMGQLEKKYLSV